MRKICRPPGRSESLLYRESVAARRPSRKWARRALGSFAKRSSNTAWGAPAGRGVWLNVQFRSDQLPYNFFRVGSMPTPDSECCRRGQGAMILACDHGPTATDGLCRLCPSHAADGRAATINTDTHHLCRHDPTVRPDVVSAIAPSREREQAPGQWRIVFRSVFGDDRTRGRERVELVGRSRPERDCPSRDDGRRRPAPGKSV